MTPQQIRRNLYRIYRRASPSDIQEGLDWYPNAHRIASDLARKYGVTLQSACGVIAALSPGNQWERNIEDADTLIADYVAGYRGNKLPRVGSYGRANIRKAERILDGEPPLTVLGGPKVRAFYLCILDPSDPETVCIDRHAKSAAYGRYLGDTVVRPNEYVVIAQQIRRCARHVGLSPLQFQAIVWTAWKRVRTSSGLSTADDAHTRSNCH